MPRGLRSVLAQRPRRAPRPRPLKAQVSSLRPLFEPLEDRLLLASLLVNSAADNLTPLDGQVTLREAILAANTDTATDLGHLAGGPDTITFAESLRGRTIFL